MKDHLLRNFLSFSGASVVIGVLGFVSAATGMFVDVNSSISVKWLLFLLLVLGTIIVILLKVIFDISSQNTIPDNFEKPFKSIASEGIFLIHRNENFATSIVVGGYIESDEIERLAYIAVVHHVQAKYIQIKVVKDMGLLTKLPSTTEELRNLTFRSVIPTDAIPLLTGTLTS